MPKKTKDFLKLCQEKYPEHAFEIDPLNAAAIILPYGLVPGIFEWFRNDPDLEFDYFEFSTCTDRPPQYLDLIYSIYSFKHRHRIGLKVRLPRENPIIPTISHIWNNANWNEREIFDLFGVFFEGHTDLRRIMMPDDWEGHPLRKDYMHPNLVSRPD